MNLKEKPNLTAGKYFIRRTKNRMIFQNKNWIGLTCGGTGSGKSYSALTIAYQLCGNRLRYVFSAKDFMILLNNPEDLQRGDIIMFDEAGVGLGARDWNSVQNKLFGSILQTFRNMNVGVIFTTPDLSYIDVQARKLLHNYMETVGIDTEKKLAVIKVYDVQNNSRYGKIYYKHPRYLTRGGVRQLKFIAVTLPPEKIVKEYEAAKSRFTKQLNAKVLKELEAADSPKLPRISKNRYTPTNGNAFDKKFQLVFD